MRREGVWRRYCGRLGCTSSRVHRENMRRRELEAVLAKTKFEHIAMDEHQRTEDGQPAWL